MTRRDPATQHGSETVVLTHALWHYDGNKHLPYIDEPVATIPGVVWNVFETALRQCHGKFTRPGVRGLAHLFQMAGWIDKQGNERPEIILPALERLKACGDQGIILLPIDDAAHLLPIAARTRRRNRKNVVCPP